MTGHRHALHLAMVLAIVVSALLVTIMPARADTTFQLETEGYITPENTVYLRALQAFDPSKTTALIGPTKKWSLSDGQNIRGFLWYRYTSDGNNWIGPEVWPHLKLAPNVTFDAELRYLWGLNDAAEDRWTLYAWPMYSLDSKNSIGVFLAHTEIIGDNKTQPWFLGPVFSYKLGPNTSISLTYVEGLEEGSGRTLTLDYVFNG